jgi:hypothetical protein
MSTSIHAAAPAPAAPRLSGALGPDVTQTAVTADRSTDDYAHTMEARTADGWRQVSTLTTPARIGALVRLWNAFTWLVAVLVTLVLTVTPPHFLGIVCLAVFLLARRFFTFTARPEITAVWSWAPRP